MAAWYPHRTLLLVYPPDDDMAEKILNCYQGDWLIYVGEGRGGANANETFMNKVEAEWDCVHIETLPTFPRCYKRLLIFKRKGPSLKPWWAVVAKWFM